MDSISISNLSIQEKTTLEQKIAEMKTAEESAGKISRKCFSSFLIGRLGLTAFLTATSYAPMKGIVYYIIVDLEICLTHLYS